MPTLPPPIAIVMRRSVSTGSLSPILATNTVGSPVAADPGPSFADATADVSGSTSREPSHGRAADESPPGAPPAIADSPEGGGAPRGEWDPDGDVPASPVATAANVKVATARLQRELLDLNVHALDGLSAFPDGEDIFTWLCCVEGPAGTPYAGIDYRVRLRFTATYPYRPPKAVFLTPCYHPNVALATGDICLDILQNQWSAVMTAGSVLLSLQSLLGSPNITSPLNSEAAAAWGALSGVGKAGAAAAYRRHVLFAAGATEDGAA